MNWLIQTLQRFPDIAVFLTLSPRYLRLAESAWESSASVTLPRLPGEKGGRRRNHRHLPGQIWDRRRVAHARCRRQQHSSAARDYRHLRTISVETRLLRRKS